MKTIASRTGTSLAAIALASLAAPAMAQDASQTGAEGNDNAIVVTAQRRAEKSVDVPITITTISSEQLADAGINALSDVARLSPALRFDSAAAFVQPTIRGVGTAVTTSGGGANVGIYVDGFYSPNPLAADFELMRLQSVQVLKGPQGTLFGRNTTGGAILLSTADPKEQGEAEITASYGRFNRQRYQAYMTGGLADGLAADVEGMFSKGNGFVRNVTTGSNRDGAYKNWSIRTGLKADVTDSVSVMLRYIHRDVNDPTLVTTSLYTDPVFGPGSQMPSSRYTTNPNETATSGPSEALTNADAVQLTIKADLGFADLTSYSQYRNEKTNLVTDLDHTAVNIFLLNYDVDNETVSQEFLLTSHPGSALQWTAGLFYFRNEDIWSTYIGTPTPANRFARLRLGGSGTVTQT
ncbi:MAG: TonB-dependent receptor plug domain-containing protein, partial [Novosphingobium sp.]|nr:TonB-dependent receptor plug domain-containing protein [Novosphingobium sp.]